MPHRLSRIRTAGLALLIIALAACSAGVSTVLPATPGIQQGVQPVISNPQSASPTQIVVPEPPKDPATNPASPQSAAASTPPGVEPLPVTTNSSGAFTQGPLSVVLYGPLDGAVISTQWVEFTGEADPDTVISFNDELVLTGPDRKFSQLMLLDEGPNVIEITASDIQGNQGTIYITITYEPES